MRITAAVRVLADLARKRRRFLTMEYIVDETIRLWPVRHSRDTALDFADTVERSAALRLERIGPERFLV